jgi:hypothetical protein
MSLCPDHAFYQPCPACRGETSWVIPIMDGDSQVGEITIPAFGEAHVSGESYLPQSVTTERFDWQPLSHSPPREVATEIVAPLAPADLPPAVPLEAVKSLLLGVDLAAARERGRRLYEEALALKESVPLLETMERLSERGRAGPQS